MSRRRQTAGIGAGRPYRIPLTTDHLARMRMFFATPIPPRLRRADIDCVPFPATDARSTRTPLMSRRRQTAGIGAGRRHSESTVGSQLMAFHPQAKPARGLPRKEQHSDKHATCEEMRHFLFSPTRDRLVRLYAIHVYNGSSTSQWFFSDLPRPEEQHAHGSTDKSQHYISSL